MEKEKFMKNSTAIYFKKISGWNLAGKIWIALSIPFVLFALWQSLENDFYKRGVDNGSRRTKEAIYSDIILKGSNVECNSIFVQQADRRIDLINVNCLSKLNPKRSIANNKKKLTKDRK